MEKRDSRSRKGLALLVEGQEGQCGWKRMSSWGAQMKSAGSFGGPRKEFWLILTALGDGYC